MGHVMARRLSTLLAVRARQISARRSTWLRLLGVVGIFVGVFGILAADRDLAKDAERFAASASLAEYRSDVESGECADAVCARDSLDDLALLVSQQPANTQDADAVFAAHIKELPITRAEHEELQSAFHSRLVAYAPAAPDTAEDAGTAEPKPRNIEAAALVLIAPGASSRSHSSRSHPHSPTTPCATACPLTMCGELARVRSI